MGTPLPFGPGGETPQEWDALYLNGVLVPGWAVVDVKRELKKDDRGAKGKSGSEPSFSGTKPAKVAIKIRYTTQAQHDFIVSDVLPLVEPNADDKKKPEILSIQHPAASARKVSAIIVDAVAGPTKGGDGVWELDIDATQSGPPETKNAAGAFKGGGGGGKTECAYLDAELRGLNQDFVENVANLARVNQELGGFLKHSDVLGDPSGEAERLKAEQAYLLAVTPPEELI